MWRAEALSGSLSAWYSKVKDYVLTRATGMCSMPGACTSLNVDAMRYGPEADVFWRVTPQWTLCGAYAWMRANNDTMNVPLAQTPPAELKLGADYARGPWSVGVLARFVGRQDRVHVGCGNIVGQDIDKSDAFQTWALHGSYRIDKRLSLAAGIDNLFDKTYAEHISRVGAAVAGYGPATTRINEPGRFLWVRVQLTLD